MRFWTWLIARLMVALLVVGGAYCVFVLPSSGEEELHRAIDALKRVRAVHYSMVADTPSQHTEEQADLVCADDSFSPCHAHRLAPEWRRHPVRRTGAAQSRSRLSLTR